MDEDLNHILEKLSAPFDPREVKFKPGHVSGNRALAMPYVDARMVQDRLDEVLGVAGWQDVYECLPDGSVVCKLSLRIGGEWIAKMDVGGQSEQSDEGDRRKAAFSDALKRAAVKFGVARYLYRLPAQWCDFDPVKKRFTRTPTLAAAPPARQPQAKAPAPEAPGVAARKWLVMRDAQVAALGISRPGDLLAYVVRELGLEKAEDLDGLDATKLAWAKEKYRDYLTARKQKAAEHYVKEANAAGWKGDWLKACAAVGIESLNPADTLDSDFAKVLAALKAEAQPVGAAG